MSFEEFPDWIDSCSLDPLTVNDNALDSRWFKVDEVRVFVQFCIKQVHRMCAVLTCCGLHYTYLELLIPAY